ncbi:unnamed protein product, partial [Vitis vinifera]
MKGSFRIEWEAEGFNRGERINACLSELKHLSSLRTLELQLSNLSLFPEDGVPFENLNLTRYSIVISPYRIRNDEYKASSRRLVFQGVTSLYMVKCFSKLLKRSQVLDLGELDDTKHVVYELDKEGFVELKYLTLSGCPTVQYILHSSTSVEWVPPPNTFCMLEELILDGLDNLEAVCHGPIPMGSFGNLRILRLESCERLKYVFSLPTQHGRESAFPQLQHLELSDLPELISFYSTRCSGTQESMTFFSQQAAFPALESLRVRRLDNLKALWHNQLPTNSFSKLKGLELIGCDELLNVFPLSVAKVLVQLEDLKISFCEVLEAIVANENEDEATSLFLFPRLTSLTLNALPQLQRFCFGRFTSRWPLLKELEVWDCDKVEILFQEIDLKSELDNKIQQSLFLVEKVALPNLESLFVGTLDNIRALRPDQLPANSFSKLRKLEVILCNKLLNLFPLSVASALVQLEDLWISWSGVEAIVANENEDEAAPLLLFPNLTSLTLRYLHQLKRFCSGRFSSSWSLLKKLEVDNCDKVEILFQQIGLECELEPLFWVEQVAFPSLESLFVCNLHNIRALWPDQLPANSFSKLRKLRVSKCNKLLNLFPLSMASALMQLEDLHISGGEVEAIVTNENEDEAAPLFLFPNLTSLTLRDLHQLKRFCSGRFSSSWPLLKKLEVLDCDKVEILFQQISLECELEPLFWVEQVALPGLESLYTDGLDNIRALCLDQLPANSFSKLRKLQVRGCNKLLNLFPVSVASALVQLEDLYISASGVEAIVANENEDEASPLLLFPNLTSLTLFSLHQLKRFCSGRFSSSWPLLKELEVVDCDKVEILFQQINLECELEPLFWVEQEAFPNLEELTLSLKGTVEIWRGQFSRVSFSKLSVLTIKEYHGISVVIPSNMVQILHNLEKLEVRMCDSVNEVIQVEIVGNDGHELIDNEIEFTRLKSLTFYHLPNLKSFCSSTRYVFKFPSLETMKVGECHGMEFFCKGVLNAPRLKSVQDEFFRRILAR